MTKWMAATVASVLMAGAAMGQTLKQNGTSKNAFSLGLGANKLVLTNSTGTLSLTNGLTISGGTVNLTGTTSNNIGAVTGGTINNVAIGGTTRAAGSFTSLNANSGLTVSAGTVNLSGTTGNNLGTASTIDLNGGTIDGTVIGGSVKSTGGFSSVDIDGGAIDGTVIGGSATAAGNFTTLNASSQIFCTMASGVSPIAVNSTTKCIALNVDTWDDYTLNNVGNTGGVMYREGTGLLSVTTAGTTGQFVRSGGSGTPTFIGLATANIFVGNGSNIPTAVNPSGDVDIDSAGVFAIQSGVVTSNDINNGTIIAEDISDGIITAAKLNTDLEDHINMATLSAGAEAADVRRLTCQLKDANNNDLSEVVLVTWAMANAACHATGSSPAYAAGYVNGAELTGVGAMRSAVTNSSGALVVDINITGSASVYFVVFVQGRCYSLNVIWA